MKVFGWRWPSSNEDAALKEADKAADLLSKGMDGYYVDPEGEPGKPYDWDKAGLDTLADRFCVRVKAGAPGKVFGVTSHYRGKAVFPKLPWKAFFKHATVLLPQAYWRVAGGAVGHGIPGDNYRRSIDFWTQTGGDKTRIVPMAGELAFSTAAEIKAYAAEAKTQGVGELHFYTHLPTVKQAVWDAIKAA
jgi:hypothetical protein